MKIKTLEKCIEYYEMEYKIPNEVYEDNKEVFDKLNEIYKKEIEDLTIEDENFINKSVEIIDKIVNENNLETSEEENVGSIEWKMAGILSVKE